MPTSRQKILNIIREARDNPPLREAARVWKSLSESAQMAAAAEILETRATELRLAYRDIINIGYGARTEEVRSKGRTREYRRVIRHQEVCITFLVKRKPARSKSGRRKPLPLNRALPRFLWTYVTVRGKHTRCIVPTDVEVLRHYRFRPHADPSRGYVLVRKDPRAERGAITCAVRIPGGGATVYALSCHHVLALSGGGAGGAPAVGAKVFVRAGQRASGPQIGRLSGHRGRLRPGSEGESFDAALAEVSDPAALKQVIVPPDPIPDVINSLDQVRNTARLFTPDGTVIKLRRVRIWPECTEIDYFGDDDHPKQRNVVEWVPTAGGTTIAGQSGSPVLNSDSRTLMGMHIAGNDQTGHAFMLPAHELFDFSRYGSGSGTLTLVTAW